MAEIICPHYSSISVILILDLIATLLALVTLAVISWFIWKKYYRQREYRNKLGHILQDCFWAHEFDIKKLVRAINGLKKRFLFREVTQLDILAYKFRIDPEKPEVYNDSYKAILQQVAYVHHFFERLQLEFSLRGVCPQYMSVCLKQTIEELAFVTIDLWSDNRIQILKSVEQYFCNSSAISEKWMSNSQLTSLVESMIPYVSQLHYSNDGTYFVLADLGLDALPSPETATRIRYIDIVLSTNHPSLSGKRKGLVDIYNTAREICLSHKYITNESHLPEIPPADQQSDLVSIHDVLMYVLHLLRVLCTERYLSELYADDTFLTLLFHLYHNICGGVDPAVQQQVIDRIKRNIEIHLQNLAEQPGIDAESTRIRLENVEKDLIRHLTLPQVQQDPKLRRKNLLRAHRNTTAKSFESEASIYTMALSASAFALQRQGTFESDLSNYQPHRFLAQQTSAEMLSAPSVYDTAPSHVSSANENTPLISNTPPSPLSSSPDQMEAARNYRPQSPMSGDSDYFETAV